VSFRLYFLILMEAMLAAGSFIAAIWFVKRDDFSLYMEFEGGWQRIAAVTITYVLASYLFDFLRQVQPISRLTSTLQLLQLTGLILIVQAVLTFVNPDLILPQNVSLIGSAISALVIVPWRLLVRPALWNAFGVQRILLVGSGPGLARLAAAFLNEPVLGSTVVGSIEVNGSPSGVEPVLGTLDDFRAAVARTSPDQIIVSTNIEDKKFLKKLMHLKASGLTVRTVGQAWEQLFGRVYSHDLTAHALIYGHELDSKPSSVALQSIYTNVLGLVTIVVALPLMLLIALLLRLTRRGPVFQKVQCVGLHGIPFYMYRFHRMHREGGNFLSRMLTRLRLEGLPEVLNLVRGEVALIGPRAERTEFHDELANLLPFYQQRHHVKPGIFGWSQLHCDPLPDEDTLARVEYDLFYIKHVSVLLDIHIVLRALRWLLSDPQSMGPPRSQRLL
jgi:lipopolysaccharide/colanic/teichoic acid biosynthesis glycosyltransferase